MSEDIPKEFIAYFAGILDGEGTVSMYRHRLNDGRNSLVRAQVKVFNRNLPMLRFIQSVFGGRLYATRRPGYVLEWNSGPEICRVLRLVQPYLIIKAGLTNVVIQFEEMRQAEQKRAWPKEKYSTEFRERANGYVDDCRRLIKEQYN